MHVDTALQRKNMVESQVRPSDVTDRRIIRAMLDVPREVFLPKGRQAVAYIDEDIALDGGNGKAPTRWLMAPRTLAKLVQLLDLGERDVVLDVAGGAGYSAAVLSRIAQTVVAVEQEDACRALATQAMAAAGIDNVAIVAGKVAEGYAAEGPYDAILVCGAVDEMPRRLLDQLKDGGRLAAVLVSGGVGRATRWVRVGSQFDRRAAFDAGLPKLPEFSRQPVFEF